MRSFRILKICRYEEASLREADCELQAEHASSWFSKLIGWTLKISPLQTSRWGCRGSKGNEGERVVPPIPSWPSGARFLLRILE